MPAHTESFSRGFDHGNFGNAYESTDYEEWIESVDLAEAAEDIEGFDESEFRAGLMLGFFSSYEIHEIESDFADEIEVLRAKYRPDETCDCTRGTFCNVAHEPTICQCGQCPKL